MPLSAPSFCVLFHLSKPFEASKILHFLSFLLCFFYTRFTLICRFLCHLSYLLANKFVMEAEK